MDDWTNKCVLKPGMIFEENFSIMLGYNWHQIAFDKMKAF